VIASQTFIYPQFVPLKLGFNIWLFPFQFFKLKQHLPEVFSLEYNNISPATLANEQYAFIKKLPPKLDILQK